MASATGPSSLPSTRAATSAEILDRVDLGEFVAGLPEGELAALLCVERDPEACHRSLITDRLAGEYGARVTHLRP